MALRKITCLLVLVAGIGLTACHAPLPLDLREVPLIPQPVSVRATGSSFTLCPHTVIWVAPDQPAVAAVGAHLQRALNKLTQQSLELVQRRSAPRAKRIQLSLITDDSLGTEGYRLRIEEKHIQLRANGPAGLFRGVQTLLQLVPLKADPEEPKHRYLASGTILDYPLYAYRGMMLDVARHFFSVEEVKRVIDLMAYCKLNMLHLHLADDQGWRIEIKSWPRLTTYGGSTEVGGGEGGFYTQEAFRELVAYAQRRHVTIVPEIDMPGHTHAALAAYPELSCDGAVRELYTGTKVGFSTLCTSKEEVYRFVDDVLRELASLTPGPYLHIGGDESHVTPLEAYIPFIERVQAMVQRYGKQPIGWDEISHANLAAGTVVQYWARSENAQRAAVQGAKVLLSPAHKMYLDMQYDSTTHLGLHWAAYLEVDSAYRWSPEDIVPALATEQILGLESPLWTETISTIDELEYMVFPRLLGHAELAWSPAAKRDWADYRQRLGRFGPRLRQLEVDYYPSDLIDWD